MQVESVVVTSIAQPTANRVMIEKDRQNEAPKRTS